MATKRQLAEQHFKRGDKLAGREGNPEAAVVEYHQALELAPGWKEAYWRMGQSFLHSTPPHSAEAINAFQKVIVLAPDWHEGHYCLGLAFEQDGQLTQAVKSYQEAIRLAPQDPRPHIALGLCLKSMKRYKEAIQAYHSAIALHPQIGETDVHLFLAEALKKSGQIQEAVEECRTVLALKSGYPSYASPAKEAAAMLAKYDKK